MNINLKILENNKEISDSILASLSPQVDKYLKKALQKIKKSLPNLIIKLIKNTPEYNSLISGQLKYEFGIPNADSAISNIIDIWSNNIIIEYNGPVATNNIIKASFSVSLIRSDYADVLSSNDSLVIDTLRGYQLPWLEWLLLEGNRIIVSKYEVKLGPSKVSRTGNAIMKSSTKSWKVPSQFSGTSSDNWITRAIENGEDEINDLLNKAFI